MFALTNRIVRQDDRPVECDETLGEFGGLAIHEDGIIVTLNTCMSIKLPRSTLSLLRRIRIGDDVAILRIGHTAYVRLLKQA
jgi:hypothetical protein